MDPTHARIDHVRIVADARRIRQEETDRLVRAAGRAAVRWWRSLTRRQDRPVEPAAHAASANHPA
jgi:hypothetical protein